MRVRREAMPDLGVDATRALISVALVVAVVADTETAVAGRVPSDHALTAAVVIACVAMAWAVIGRWRSTPPPAISVAAMHAFDFIALGVLAWLGVRLPVLGLLPLASLATGLRLGTPAFCGAVAFSLVLGAIHGLRTPGWVASDVLAIICLLGVTPVLLYLAMRTQRQASDDAVQLQDKQREFLGRVSHDLRSPLHVIMATTMMIDRTALSREDAGQIDTIEAASKTLLDMVSDLLDGSAIADGRVHLKPVDFRMHHLIDQVRIAVQGRADAQNIALSWSINERIPALYGPKRHLEQVAVNLLTNAIKYTPPGGRVHVSAHHYVLDKTRPHAVSVVFSVADNGIGIAPDDKKRLFDPFTQVSRHAGQRNDGVGMGLAICKSIIDQMGGAIEVNDNPGGGTVFTLHAPLTISTATGDRQDDDGVTPLAKMDRHRALTPPLRCLLIDDSKSNTSVISRILMRCGHQVDIRDDGTAGLQAIRTGAYDLVLMDLHMPGMSGWDVLAALAATPDHAPIVVLSAATDEATQQEAVRQGARWALSKPLDLERLLAVLSTRAEEIPSPHAAERRHSRAS